MPVKVDMLPFLRFRTTILTMSGPVKTALKQWAAIYRGFVRERFDKYSKGGGDWKPLAASTIAGRRKGSGVGLVAAILRDTGTLMNALDPGRLNPGAIEQPTSFGITVGYGGGDRHPKGVATIANIAEWHDQGTVKMPKRPIIVSPNTKTTTLMAKVMDIAAGIAARG